MLGKTQCINQIAFVNCMAYISNKLTIITPDKRTDKIFQKTVTEVLFTEAKMRTYIILTQSLTQLKCAVVKISTLSNQPRNLLKLNVIGFERGNKCMSQ